MKRISRLPVWWQLFIGLACCFLFSLIVICASFFIDIKEAEKNNWSYLHRMNSQWELEIETITKNLDYLQYLPLIDKDIMTNLRNDYQKQSLKKQLSNSNYVNNILEDICGINPFILRATILTKNGNIYGNFVEDSLKQVEQAQDHIVYSKAGHKNEKYITDIYEGEINMLPYKLLTIAYAMYPVTSDEKLATIYIDLNFEEIEKSFSVFSNNEIECCLFNKNGMIYSSEKENTFLLKDVKNIYENSDHQGVLETDGTVWNAYVVKITDLDWYLVQCMPKKSFTFNSTKNILPFCFLVLMIFVFLLFGGMQLISRITKPISEFSNALNQVTLHKKQKPRHIQLSEDVPEEISTMVSGYNDLVSRIEENIILAYKNEISQKKTELQKNVCDFYAWKRFSDFCDRNHWEKINENFTDYYTAQRLYHAIYLLENLATIDQNSDPYKEILSYVKSHGINLKENKKYYFYFKNYFCFESYRLGWEICDTPIGEWGSRAVRALCRFYSVASALNIKIDESKIRRFVNCVDRNEGISTLSIGQKILYKGLVHHYLFLSKIKGFLLLRNLE